MTNFTEKILTNETTKLSKQYLPIVTHNISGWRWRRTKEAYKKRLERTLEQIRGIRLYKVEGARETLPFTVGLSEVALNRGKYLITIRKHMPEYEVIEPVGYDPDQSPNSIVNLLLIRKDLIQSYEVLEMPGLAGKTEKWLGYNYVIITTKWGEQFRILHVRNCPTTNTGKALWYQRWRVDLHMEIMEAIMAKVDKYHEQENFILMGDFNRTPDDETMKKLRFYYTMLPLADEKKPTFQSANSSSHIDYIFVSAPTIAKETHEVFLAETVELPWFTSTSDHAILIGCVAV